MSKNKLKIIAFLTILMLALTIPIVRAEDEQPTPVESSDTTNSNQPDNITALSNEDPESNNSEEMTSTTNEKQGDVYLTGDNVTIDYPIEGNLFVLANQVTIQSSIAGDAFICSNTVTVGESAYIYSNLFAFSKNVNIDGIVYDLYAASENTTINGTIGRDIRVGSDTINIFGSIKRNAFIHCENLNLTQNSNVTAKGGNVVSSESIINGNLTYSSNKEASIPNGTVAGKVHFEKEAEGNDSGLPAYLLSLGTFIATVMIVWLLSLWLAPNFLKKTPSCLTNKKVLPVIGLGILTPIVSILLVILLFILGITAAFAMILLATLLILIAISVSVFLITIQTILCEKLKIEKTIAKLGVLIGCAIALWFINLIPYLGSLTGTASVILGLGIIVSNFILKEKVEKAN